MAQHTNNLTINHSPITIFVGTQKEQMLALKVLEYSIRKHTSLAVRVIPLFQAVAEAQIKIPVPQNPANHPRTPFSFQRFAIPQLQAYQGRAIYLDSDMQVFQDIRQLWEWEFGGANLLAVAEPVNSGRAPQFSVMVLNCEELNWDAVQLIAELDSGKWTYEQLVLKMAPASNIYQILPTCWNELERYEAGKTALTHYTDMPSQPWLSTENPLGWLWCQELLEAIRVGFIAKQFLAEEVARGWVRPSLWYQLENNIIDPLELPESVMRCDSRYFLPPHAVKQPLSRIIHSPHSPRLIRRFATQGYLFARYCWQLRRLATSK